MNQWWRKTGAVVGMALLTVTSRLAGQGEPPKYLLQVAGPYQAGHPNTLVPDGVSDMINLLTRTENSYFDAHGSYTASPSELSALTRSGAPIVTVTAGDAWLTFEIEARGVVISGAMWRTDHTKAVHVRLNDPVADQLETPRSPEVLPEATKDLLVLRPRVSGHPKSF